MKRGRKPKCPYCGASNNIAKGVRKTVTMGQRPLRVCKNCHRKFTVRRAAPVKAAAPKGRSSTGPSPAATEAPAPVASAGQ